jgi:outer membrane protein
MGEPAQTEHLVKTLLHAEQPDVPGDSLISYALQNRNEMQISRERTGMAQLHLKVVRSQNNPSLNLIADGGFKNGYVPDINSIRANYVVGLKLNIPILQGNRTKYNILDAQSAIETTSLETEITQRTISGEVIENETNVETALKKESQSRMQLELAKEALSLAETNYKAGAITNLDLLDATTAVSESQLMLLKTRIDYVVSIYKLRASLGEDLYK